MGTGPLTGKVAVVAGGSRNIGRGIAVELARAGAEVWITGRTEGESEQDLGTLRGTTAQIASLGGAARWVRCDHRDDAEVKRAFDQILEGSGRVDILVNNASPDFSPMVGKPFWEVPPDAVAACLEIGPKSDLVAMCQVVPSMLNSGGGLIVNISSHGSHEYVLSVPYGAGKAAIDKITHDTALELRDHGVCVVSLWPGYVTGREAGEGMEFLADDPVFMEATRRIGESPSFPGRAVVALASANDMMRWSGCAVTTRRLGDEYGFVDADGSRPQRDMRFQTTLSEEEIPALFRILEPFGTSQMSICD